MTATDADTTNSKLTLMSSQKRRMQVRTPKRTKERQESRLKDLVKFERLCCRGDDHACERLGCKHHRSNTKCWLYPEICYHCNIVNSNSERSDPSCQDFVRSLPVKLERLPLIMNCNNRLEKASDLNKRNTEVNKMLSPQGSQSLEDKWRFRALASFMLAWHAQPEHNPQMVTDPRDRTVPDIQIGSIPAILVASIEEDDPMEPPLPEFVEDDETVGEDRSPQAWCCRSQAPSPEVSQMTFPQPGHRPTSSDADNVSIGKRDGETTRDPRCEVGFVLN